MTSTTKSAQDTFTLDKTKLTEQLIRAQKNYAGQRDYYVFLNSGGMAFADHKGETLRQLLKAIDALKDLNYYEKLVGVEPTPCDLQPCRYVKKDGPGKNEKHVGRRT